MRPQLHRLVGPHHPRAKQTTHGRQKLQAAQGELTIFPSWPWTLIVIAGSRPGLLSVGACTSALAGLE